MTDLDNKNSDDDGITASDTVFLSYKREDELTVAKIAEALKAEGFKLWWDRRLAGGESWREQIQDALHDAGCVVVFWSHKSVGPSGDFVRDVAGQAKRRDILVPVTIDKVTLPLGFGELQAIDLSLWKGKRSDPFFQDLCAAINAKLNGVPVPPATGALQRLKRRLTIGSLASGLILGGGAFAFNLFGMQDQLCALPVGQPAISDSCAAMGLGNRPTREERLAWEDIQHQLPGSCNLLRAYIDRFPQGYFHGIAADLIAARKEVVEEVWQPTANRRLTFYQRRTEQTFPDEKSARAAALVQAHKAAERLCRSFAATAEFKFIGAESNPHDWECDTLSSGVSCGFDGEAICQLEERRKVVSETCGRINDPDE